MKNWYQQLTNREKLLFKFGCVLILVVFLWLLVYRPVVASLEDKTSRLQLLKGQLSEMQTTANKVSGSNTVSVQSPLAEGVTFSTWLDRQLEKHELISYIRRTEPVDKSTTIVWFNNVPFDPMVDWLQKSRHQFGVFTKQMDVTVTDRSLGLVNLRITLGIDIK